MNEENIIVDGIECQIYETTALEAWLAMHGLRRVLCGDADHQAPKTGCIAHVVARPLEPKEIAFIEEQSACGEFPSLDKFLGISGLVGVTDFEIVESTDLPGWDGSPNPVILSNPRWFIEGKLVPCPPDIVIQDESPATESRLQSRQVRRAARRAAARRFRRH